MASNGPSYGFSREVKMKLKAKYDPSLEPILRTWIAETANCDPQDDLSFQDFLKDGIKLCMLMNSLVPGIIANKKLPNTRLLNPFRCMENISAFLDACREFGVEESSLFQTADLYNRDPNLSQAKSKGLTDIDIGIYVAEKQHKNWTEEELRRGDGIIGLQAGTNKCASQAGMTPYGAARTVYDKKYTGKGEEADDENNYEY